jgi:serine protease Do
MATVQEPVEGAVQEIESTIREVADRVGPAVVGIGRGWGLGSGIVVQPGRVLTTAYNLRHNEVAVTYGDGRREDARVVAVDDTLGLAVLEVDTAELTPLRFPEDLSSLDIGRFVLALANPGGRGLHAAPGFVASAGRPFRGPRGRRLAGAIAHTAPLPRGSAGGPLLDVRGALLAINVLRVDPGLILALPADATMRARVEALVRGERPDPVRLGVAVAPPRVARRLRRAVGLPERDGVLIRAVQEDSPAARARLQRGDLIISAGGRPVDGIDALYEALDRLRTGDRLELGIVRGTEEQTVEVGL